MNLLFRLPIDLPKTFHVHDFTKNCPGPLCQNSSYSIGKYKELRHFYTEPLFKEKNRNIHMGIDFGAPAETPIYAVSDCTVHAVANHNTKGDYGPTVVTKNVLSNNQTLFCLYGHISLKSLDTLSIGQQFAKNEVIAHIGDTHENGNWPPHLHFQISLIEPIDANMPGVVAKESLSDAEKLYPDPQIYFGKIY